MQHLKRRFAFIALTISAVLFIGTVGFVLIEHWSVFDAFYMAIITISTVGYKEIYDLSFAGRVFNSILIMVGVSTMFLAVGAMTQTIIELEFNKYFEKRRVRKMIEQLYEHYIICGFGRVGRGAALELQRAGAPLIVIDNDDDKIEWAMKAGMLAVHGDASRDENLRDIGVERAKGLIAALETDADNLFLILSAKGLNPNLKVSARVSEEESEQKFRRAGADSVFAPYTITGSRLAQSILRPHVVQFLDFAAGSMGVKVTIEQVRVEESCPYVSQSLREMQLRSELGVIVLAIRKSGGAMVFNPEPETQIQGGEFLIAMGEAKQLRKLEILLARPKR
jgi:voltage-gated potassium channel